MENVGSNISCNSQVCELVCLFLLTTRNFTYLVFNRHKSNKTLNKKWKVKMRGFCWG